MRRTATVGAIEPLDAPRAVNLRNWESRVAIHAASSVYDLAGLASDPNALSRVAAFDVVALGELRDVDGVHLQCHIGTDTVSLARAGARMSGVDFSPQALSVARDLAASCGVDVRFVESELFSVPQVLGRDFDLVYTGVGALCWLPDIAGWARVVAGLLRPGGRLYVRDAHPMLNAIDDASDDDVLRVTLPYFEGVPQRWAADQTYTDGPPLESPETYEWNHGLGEIVQAVIDAGLTVTALREHRECEWQALSHMEQGADGRYRLAVDPERLPLMFTLEAMAPSDGP